MLKTKFTFQSDCLMSEEEIKRHEEYIKKHKPKGLSYEEVLLKKYIEKEKKERGKSKC